MYRTRLVFAAGAAALIAGAALAQDTPAPQDPPFPQPGPEVPQVPESPANPTPEPEVRDVEPATAAGTPARVEGDVVAVLRREAQFSTLVSALEASGLIPVIEANPDITIFAPTDAAFAALHMAEVAYCPDQDAIMDWTCEACHGHFMNIHLMRGSEDTFGFIALDGRWVGNDIVFDGNTSKDSHSVDPKDALADLVLGVAITRGPWKFTATHVRRTREFEGQAELPAFGTLTFSRAF